MKESPVKIDVLLEPLLAGGSDEQVDELLSQLITVHAGPVIKSVIRFKLRFTTNRDTQRAEADDIHQEVVLQLLAQLQRFRKLPDNHPITDLRGMAAVIAHRTCAGWLRRQRRESGQQLTSPQRRCGNNRASIHSGLCKPLRPLR